MKKIKLMLCSVIIFLVFIFAVLFISRAFMDSRRVSEDEIQEIVFLNSGSSYNDVSDYKCITSVSEDGILMYEVSYVDSKGVYKFLLECETGKIIEFTELKNSGFVSETWNP